MLQRAASNAYSWWWASHVRTKQSKWLEQNLQDMGEKVECMLKLIEEDGDSFAKRAEMYYKKRPELINFVEESYRAYRALAERYDHISTELQNANNTIASVFPEQVQFAMDEDDDDGIPRFQKKFPDASKQNIPKVPKPPNRDLKGLLTMATKNLRSNKAPKSAAASTTTAKSGLSKPEAVEEIDMLQKGILSLQTEKEFVKSSYEHDLAKYWEIEKKITEMQERICGLQDEFGVGSVIEDDEARTLMAAAALKSCQETLGQLQKKQEKSAEEARVEHQRIKGAHEKLESLRNEFLPDQVDREKPNDKDESVDAGENFRNLEQDEDSMTKERQELELLREKIKEHFDVGSKTSLTVTEMAEKIDELVNKVINLSTAVSSQSALIKRLRTETDELQSQIWSLEDDKATMVDGTNNLSNKLRKMEKKLHGIQDLNQDVEVQNINLQTHFTEAHCHLDHLSEKLHRIKPDEELEIIGSLQRKDGSVAEVKSQKEFEEQENTLGSGDNVEKLHGTETNEKLEAAASSQKGEGPLVEVVSQKVIKDEGDALNAGDGFKKAGDGQTEVGEGIKVLDLSTSVQNQTDENLEAAASSKNEEGSKVEVQPRKEIKDQGAALNPGDGFEKAGDVQTEVEEDNDFKKYQDPKLEDDPDKQDSNQMVDNLPNIEPQEKGLEQEGEPNWQQLFVNGLDDRQKILLTEYTKTLRNYKSVKKQLSEVEKKNQDSLLETKAQLRALRSVNDKKDAEIRSLQQKLSLLQINLDENKDLKEFKDSNHQPTSNLLDDQDVEPRARTEESTATETPTEEKEEDDVEAILIDQPQSISTVEDKFRMSIDELLEENLNFWLRFSTSFHQIQKFQTGVEDLQAEISKIKEKVKPDQEGSSTIERSFKSDARPIYKHLSEIQTELTLWLEQSALLKDELQCRFSSLCNIQEEITRALEAGSEDEEIKFTSYQAAKFQGEILNMKQENNKVADELQAGLDHVTGLQLEIEKTLANLNEDFGISGSKGHNNFQLRHSTSRSRVPLRSFIFGVKPKKQKPSFFACMSPALHKKYNHLRTGTPL